MGRKSEYTQKFQDNAVKMVVADGMLYAVAARQLKITPAKLRSWVHRWKRDS
ncbi:MAG: transposase, partial [Candidatus Obscuribacter sp.]|nr:transposase [Candidatus Obscuribacter sp.]